MFEDFVAASLTDALKSIDSHAVAQDSQRIDEAGTVRMNPDLVWYRGNHAAAVIDAKYKTEKPSGYPNADLYQLLAYCTALGLDEGHLVYAQGAGDPAVHIVREAGVRLVAHAVDLDQLPDQLIKQMVAIAGRVAAGVELQVQS